MAIWSSGLGSPGFCSEMSLPALQSDCIKKCSYGVNREGFFRSLRRVIFFYGAVFVLIVEDMESICTLRVVTFGVAGVLLVPLLQASASLADVLLVACHTCQCVDATSVVGCGGRVVLLAGLERCEIVLLHLQAILMLVLLNHHPLYTDTTCTHPTHHIHTPLAAPNNTYTTHLLSSIMHHNTHAPYTRPDRHTNQIPNKRHGIHIYTRITDYVYISLLHTKTLRLSHLAVLFPSCYSAEHHMRQCTLLYS